MRSRFAGLVAMWFAAAVTVPELGLVVHRHAGGDHLHVHAGFRDRPHPDEPGRARRRDASVVTAHDHHGHAADDDHDQPGDAHHHVADDDHRHHADHDHQHHDDHAHPHPVDHDHPHDAAGHDGSTGTELNVATAGWALHVHWKQPFQRVALSKPPVLLQLRPVARLTLAAPHQRIATPRVPGRSRAPPPARSI